MPVAAEPAVDAGDATLVPAIDLATEPPVVVDEYQAARASPGGR